MKTDYCMVSIFKIATICGSKLTHKHQTEVEVYTCDKCNNVQQNV